MKWSGFGGVKPLPGVDGVQDGDEHEGDLGHQEDDNYHHQHESRLSRVAPPFPLPQVFAT